jgi:hypothetical protein
VHACHVLCRAAGGRGNPTTKGNGDRRVGYFAPGPITAPNSLMDIELPRPSAMGRRRLGSPPACLTTAAATRFDEVNQILSLAMT